MSGAVDSQPGPAVGDTSSAPGSEYLLVVVEPVEERDARTSLILRAEGARLARELGVGARFVAWETGPDADLEPLADGVAAAAGRRAAVEAGARAYTASAVAQAQPAAVIMADTDVGRQLAPMVAQRLASGAVLGCSDVREALTFVKPVYGGWLEQEITPAAGSTPVATLDLSGIEMPAISPEAPKDLEVLEIVRPERAEEELWDRLPRLRRVESIPPDPDSVDLVHAQRIVAAGSGSARGQLLAAVHELAGLLQGSVGTTRPVVDDGLLPKERLIGQTGRTVAPELYLALGISGSPHHVAGVRGADRILSVNRDIRAPIFQFSDVGYVADLEVVLPALVERIKGWRDAAGPGQGPDGYDSDPRKQG